MYIEVNDTIMRIWFSYGDKEEKNRTASCEIRRLKDADDKEGEIIGRGKAECSAKDLFNKAKGRKLAFTRAINQVYPDTNPNNKALRAEAFAKYFSISKI